MKKYNRNINVKTYRNVEEIYDSVNNDPKRPGYQVVYLDRSRGALTREWFHHLAANGYGQDSVAIKYPKIGNEEYVALIIYAEPADALALKFCF